MEKRIMSDPIITVRDTYLLTLENGNVPIKYSEINKISIKKNNNIRGQWCMTIIRGASEIQFYFNDKEINEILNLLDYIERVNSDCVMELNELKSFKGRKTVTEIAYNKEIQKNKISRDYGNYLLTSLNGCRGKSIEVYTDRVVINASITTDSIITSNTVDGKKTIYYKDIVEIKYKEPASSSEIGYIQLETTSNLMDNNTFTFSEVTDMVRTIKEYIALQVAKNKRKNN